MLPDVELDFDLVPRSGKRCQLAVVSYPQFTLNKLLPADSPHANQVQQRSKDFISQGFPMYQRTCSTFSLSLIALATICSLPSNNAMGSISIEIQDGSFEYPQTDMAQEGFVSPWIGGPYGVWDITWRHDEFWDEGVLAPHQSQIGYVAHPGLGGGITQTLTATLQSNTVYTLKGYVGHPLQNQTDYTIELLAGITTLATFDESAPVGSFMPFELVFDSIGSSLLGQTLAIRLISGAGQTAFDAFELNAIPSSSVVPEPATLLTWGGLALTGLCYAAGRRWRQQNGFAAVN